MLYTATTLHDVLSIWVATIQLCYTLNQTLMLITVYPHAILQPDGRVW